MKQIFLSQMLKQLIPLDSEQRLDILMSENPDPKTLHHIAKSSGTAIQQIVGKHPATEYKTLEKLSKSRHAIVVVSVAQNPKTPANLLHNIFNKYYPHSQICSIFDETTISQKNMKNNNYVISSVLGNPNKPQYILNKYFQIILLHPDFCLGLVKDTSLTTIYTEQISCLIKFHAEQLKLSKKQEWDKYKIDNIAIELLKNSHLSEQSLTNLALMNDDKITTCMLKNDTYKISLDLIKTIVNSTSNHQILELIKKQPNIDEETSILACLKMLC